MNNLDIANARIAELEKQLKEKQAEINLADEPHHYDVGYSYKRENGFLICIIITMAIWIATP